MHSHHTSYLGPFLWLEAVEVAFHLGFVHSQVPTPLRNMIGRSFAAEDAHDKIRAAVIDLFEILELEATGDIEKVRTDLGSNLEILS